MSLGDQNTAFSFRVSLPDGTDLTFREVLGLEPDLAVDALSEGGENRFVHRLPKPGTHPKLTLKHCTCDLAGTLMRWCKDTLEGGFTQPMVPKDLGIALVDKTGDSVARWKVTQALPTKWSVGAFHAMTQHVELETLELACARIERQA